MVVVVYAFVLCDATATHASCFRKIQIGFTFLVPAHPCSPGQRAVKWVCVCVRACVRVCYINCFSLIMLACFFVNMCTCRVYFTINLRTNLLGTHYFSLGVNFYSLVLILAVQLHPQT